MENEPARELYRINQRIFLLTYFSLKERLQLIKEYNNINYSLKRAKS